MKAFAQLGFSLIASLTLLAGCATTSTNLPSRSETQATANVAVTGRTHPTVRAIQNCVGAAIQAAGYQNLTVLVGTVDAEATGGTYAKGMPQPLYNTLVASVLRELGFRPINPASDLRKVPSDLRAVLKPDLVVNGSITGFDALVSRYRDALDGGIGFGNGRGLTNISAGVDHTLSLGQVTATVNIEAPAARGKEGLAWYPVSATASSTADFQMTQSNQNATAAVVIGIGGGYAKENVRVVDVQSAAKFAVRMALILALADELKISTPRCT